MSEAELHLIRARLDGGLRNKAERGELRAGPAGRAGSRRGRPDRAVGRRAGAPRDRARVRAVAAAGLGAAGRHRADRARASSCRAGRSGSGGCAGRAPSYGAVHDFLTNPAYAGAFVFGRTRTEKRARRAAGACAVGRSSCRSSSGPSACPSTIPAMCPGTSTSPRASGCAANVRPRGEGGGAAREGAALLQGIVRCGRCGRRMQVAYSGNDGRVAALCVRARAITCMAPITPASRSAALRLEKAVAAAFLEAVTPAGVARLAREAVGELERQHDERLAGQRLARRARRVRGRPRATPVRRLRARAPARRPHAGSAPRSRRSRELERERRKLAELERRRPEPLDRRRAPGARAARAATCRGCGTRRQRPPATARSCCAR